MSKRTRTLLVMAVWLIAFVGLMNTAVIASGALVILGIGPMQWLGDKGLRWAGWGR